MIGVSEEELKRDRERLINFIKKSYPDYNFIEYDLLKQKQSLEQYAVVWRDQPRPYERNLWKHIW